jgi:hypothetical protein
MLYCDNIVSIHNSGFGSIQARAAAFPRRIMADIRVAQTGRVAPPRIFSDMRRASPDHFGADDCRMWPLR